MVSVSHDLTNRFSDEIQESPVVAFFSEVECQNLGFDDRPFIVAEDNAVATTGSPIHTLEFDCINVAEIRIPERVSTAIESEGND